MTDYERNIENTACAVCGTLGFLLGIVVTLAGCALAFYLRMKGAV